VEQGTPPPTDWTPQSTTYIRTSTTYDTLAKPLGISPIQVGTAKTPQKPIAGQANTQPTKPAEESTRPQITPEKVALYMRRLEEGMTSLMRSTQNGLGTTFQTTHQTLRHLHPQAPLPLHPYPQPPHNPLPPPSHQLHHHKSHPHLPMSHLVKTTPPPPPFPPATSSQGPPTPPNEPPGEDDYPTTPPPRGQPPHTTPTKWSKARVSHCDIKEVCVGKQLHQGVNTNQIGNGMHQAISEVLIATLEVQQVPVVGLEI